ncbi:MAG: cbb3-type cytochrome c oxidase subunit I [Sediminibacterium sp.]|nr:cbb3-type cytochrome c oxidase subunit I [Sediminibacterium sp.]
MDSFISKQGFNTRKIIKTGIILLLLGLIFGVFGAIQYVIPGFLKEQFSFEKIRPLHVSSALFWIILTAIGVLITYLQEHTGKSIHSTIFLQIQYYLFVLAITCIFISYFAGIFGGREYWEYPPNISILILLGWVLMLINYVKSIKSLKQQPVYIWMWLTGIVFFLFTFSESYLWLFPYFKNNIINDMTIQ